MVKLLLQKMLRDMRKSIAAYGICLLIVAVGFCGYCLMSVAEDHLIASRDLLYERSSFADGFAEVQEAPAAITDKIKEIPGITDANARIIKEVRIKEENQEQENTKFVLVPTWLVRGCYARKDKVDYGMQMTDETFDYMKLPGFQVILIDAQTGEVRNLRKPTESECYMPIIKQ